MENTITTEETKVKSVFTSNIPATDIDFGQVASDVAAKWMITPGITLLWTNAAEFSNQVAAYRVELSQRNKSGSNRPQITNRLRQLDTIIDDSLIYVKGYLMDKYKKEAAPSYYAAFGIEHKSRKYNYPTDRNKRSKALELMITALVTYGFQDKEFGLTFWSALKTEYDDLLGQTITLDGVISHYVSNKNQLRIAIKKTINALIHTIKANYPNSYKAELRAWGFQKEKY